MAAARLVKVGKVFSLAIPLDQRGPQRGDGRSNPVHSMSFDGGDEPGLPHGIGFADDTIFMPLQAPTQWDALAHALGLSERAIGELEDRGVIGTRPRMKFQL